MTSCKSTGNGAWKSRETNREQGQTIKGHKSRTVPLHDEVVRHLIPYWQSLPPGPLFPKLPKAKTNNARSAYVARKIQEWIREDLQIKDRNLAPNHSFRHYLKSQLLDRDVQERISDAITGHKTPGIGRKYEHVELSKKIWAIDKAAGDPAPGQTGRRRIKTPTLARAGVRGKWLISLYPLVAPGSRS